MPINELRSITIFAKISELGSLRKAAEAQHMTPQAASQALAQLEQHLGVRLFHRTTRSVALTDAGRQLLDASMPAVATLQQALAMTRRTTEEVAGPLRIVGRGPCSRASSGPCSTNSAVFIRMRSPDVELDDRIGNWVDDRVDVGFRIGISPAEGASPASSSRCS